MIKILSHKTTCINLSSVLLGEEKKRKLPRIMYHMIPLIQNSRRVNIKYNVKGQYFVGLES